MNSLLLADVRWCRGRVWTAEMFVEWRKLGDAMWGLAGLVMQRGLRLRMLPRSRGRWVVHEQIEGRVDSLFVHATGTLRGLQAWKNHSWVRHQPSQLLLRAEGCLLQRGRDCQGVPFFKILT